MNALIIVLITLYFVVLTAERIQSLVRSASKKVLLDNGLHKYMAGLCFASFAGTIVLLIAFAISVITGSHSNLPLLLISAAVGCILLSGMVHTEYSIPGIQFGSYGALIVAMIFKLIQQTDILTPGKRIVVLIYLIAFSMAIPVVYQSNIEKKKTFHCIESIVSFCLVWAFAYMFYFQFAGNYAKILNPTIILATIACDSVVIAMRRKEEINWFVLVALCIACVFWVASFIVLRV